LRLNCVPTFFAVFLADFAVGFAVGFGDAFSVFLATGFAAFAPAFFLEAVTALPAEADFFSADFFAGLFLAFGFAADVFFVVFLAIEGEGRIRTRPQGTITGLACLTKLAYAMFLDSARRRVRVSGLVRCRQRGARC
jgi:preprotein translocase subunit SecY